MLMEGRRAREALEEREGTVVRWKPAQLRDLERHRVETQRSMAAVLAEIRPPVEPLFGVVAGALGLRVLERLQVARPSLKAAEPRVQVWTMRTEMRELSQVAEDREERAFQRCHWPWPHLQEAPVLLDTFE